jgi:hypothetical protein
MEHGKFPQKVDFFEKKWKKIRKKFEKRGKL